MKETKKLVLFTSENCACCAAAISNIKKLNKDIPVVIFDSTAKNEKYLYAYRVLSVPTTLLVDEKNCELDRFYGVKDIDYIKEFYSK